MKNILVIHQSADLYGSDKTLLLLLSQLDKENFFAVVVVPCQGPLVEELEKAGIKVVIAPVLKLYRDMFTVKNLYKFVKEASAAYEILKGLHELHNFNLVYSNTLAVLLGMVFAAKKKIRHIWHVHEIIRHPAFIAALFPWFLKKYADVIICNSQATKNNLISRIPSLVKKSVVVYNGIDAPEPATGNILHKTDLGFLDDDIVVTLVGRINRLKGHKWLLNSYTRYISNPNIKLLFVGSPVPGQEYHLAEINDIINKANINNSVQILPFMQDLAPVWRLSDIAVMPSTEEESFGLVALEAMLAARPVIASDAGGLKEIVVNAKTGLLVAPLDEQALATAILKLAGSEDLRNSYGKNGQERALAEFSLENYIRGIKNVLKDY